MASCSYEFWFSHFEHGFEFSHFEHDFKWWEFRKKKQAWREWRSQFYTTIMIDMGTYKLDKDFNVIGWTPPKEPSIISF